VSLILEALKKVERERAAAQPHGFLVVGPATWAGSRSNAAWIAAVFAAALVAGGVVYVFTRPAAPAPAAIAAPAPRPARDPELRLSAISERDGRPVAVVNDRVVGEGDTVEGARVVRIGAAEVDVEVGGARRTLRF
jgi:hypothetical protein